MCMLPHRSQDNCSTPAASQSSRCQEVLRREECAEVNVPQSKP